MSIAELLELKEHLSNNFTEKKNFYLALSYFGNEEYDLSKKYFLTLLPEDSVSEREKLKKIFSKKRNLRPNSKTAKILSIIIPGAGQIYTGQSKSGINSLILTGIIAIIGYDILFRYGKIDAIVSVLPWLIRYYKGNIKNAENLALTKREKRKNNVYKKIIEIIEKNK